MLAEGKRAACKAEETILDYDESDLSKGYGLPVLQVVTYADVAIVSSIMVGVVFGFFPVEEGANKTANLLIHRAPTLELFYSKRARTEIDCAHIFRDLDFEL